MKLSWVVICAALVYSLGAGSLSAAIFSIRSNAADNYLSDSTPITAGSFKDGGTVIGNNVDELRLGSGGTGGLENIVGMYFFPLPTLAPGEVFSNASFTYNMTTKEGTVTGFNIDVYALPTLRSTAALAVSDFYIGPYGNDPTDAFALQDNFLTSITANGLVNSSASANTTFTSFLNSLYAGNTDPTGGPGQFLYLRLNPDSDPLNGNHRYRVSQSSAAPLATDPTITLTTTAIPEPSTWAVLSGGLILGSFVCRRHRR